MAGLSVKFTALDEISAKFDNMAKAGTKATEAFSNMERTGDKAMDNVASNMDNVTQGMKTPQLLQIIVQMLWKLRQCLFQGGRRYGRI